MNEKRLKAIVEEVVNKAVDPIKETLKNHTRILGDHTRILESHSKILEGHSKTLEGHTSRLEALSGDMEQVLSEVKATHDEIGLWHQRDKREIDEIKEHLNLPLMSDVPQA